MLSEKPAKKRKDGFPEDRLQWKSLKERKLRKRNLYYETNKGKSFKVRIYNASVNYNSWCRGIELDEKEIKDIKQFIGSGPETWNKDVDWFEYNIKVPKYVCILFICYKFL